MTVLRVLIVEDSLTVREALIEALSNDPEFEIVGQCASGEEALRFLEKRAVDVISLDMVLPGASGLDVTRRVVAATATPILICSASANRGEAMSTLDALNAGAVDLFDKSVIGRGPGWEAHYKSALRLVSKIRVVRRPQGAQRQAALIPLPSPKDGESRESSARCVCIGASTGGPSAVLEVLQGLTPTFELPLLVVIHLSPLFADSLVSWLAQRSPLPVRLARDNEPVPLPGTSACVLLAPPEQHMVIHEGRIRLLQTPERHSCRPSVDVLFESVAAELGGQAIGVLLTGMGRDGAAGLLAMRNRGAVTICQDQESSAVFGMPREAIALGAANHILPLNQVAPQLLAEAERMGQRSKVS